MKRPSGITTVESNVVLPVTLLEDHVNSKHHPLESGSADLNLPRKSFSNDFENIYWCTEELLIDGTVDIYFAVPGLPFHYCLSIPVETGFMAICTRGKSKNYKLEWTASLS